MRRRQGSSGVLFSLIAEIESKPDDIDCATNARRLPGGPLGAA